MIAKVFHFCKDKCKPMQCHPPVSTNIQPLQCLCCSLICPPAAECECHKTTDSFITAI